MDVTDLVFGLMTAGIDFHFCPKDGAVKVYLEADDGSDATILFNFEDDILKGIGIERNPF